MADARTRIECPQGRVGSVYLRGHPVLRSKGLGAVRRIGPFCRFLLGNIASFVANRPFVAAIAAPRRPSLGNFGRTLGNTKGQGGRNMGMQLETYETAGMTRFANREPTGSEDRGGGRDSEAAWRAWIKP